MRVLLCLLTDQHVPNLLSVHHFRPDRLVLLESEAMRKKQAAGHFLQALTMGGLDYRERCDTEALAAEDNLDLIVAALKRCYSLNPSADWTVNLSGGTKPMSIAAYEFFKALGAGLVYVSAQRPNEFLGLANCSTEQCSYRPSVYEFLAGYGFEPRKSLEEVRKSEERALYTWDCAREIAATCPQRGLFMVGDLEDAGNKKKWDQARRSGIEAEPTHFPNIPPNVRDAVRECFRLNADGDSLRGHLDKYSVEFLTGGWLEVFLWRVLSRHADGLRIWDVRLGLQAGKAGIRTDSEFDIVFMDRYRMAVVECKSGRQEHDPATEVQHKVEAVVRQFRALLVNSYLATTSPYVLDKSGELKESVRNRAAVYGSKIIDLRGIQRIAENPDSLDVVRDVLFGGTDA